MDVILEFLVILELISRLVYGCVFELKLFGKIWFLLFKFFWYLYAGFWSDHFFSCSAPESKYLLRLRLNLFSY